LSYARATPVCTVAYGDIVRWLRTTFLYGLAYYKNANSRTWTAVLRLLSRFFVERPARKAESCICAEGRFETKGRMLGG